MQNPLEENPVGVENRSGMKGRGPIRPKSAAESGFVRLRKSYKKRGNRRQFAVEHLAYEFLATEREKLDYVIFLAQHDRLFPDAQSVFAEYLATIRPGHEPMDPESRRLLDDFEMRRDYDAQALTRLDTALVFLRLRDRESPPVSFGFQRIFKTGWAIKEFFPNNYPVKRGRQGRP